MALNCPMEGPESSCQCMSWLVLLVMGEAACRRRGEMLELVSYMPLRLWLTTWNPL